MLQTLTLALALALCPHAFAQYAAPPSDADETPAEAMTEPAPPQSDAGADQAPAEEPKEPESAAPEESSPASGRDMSLEDAKVNFVTIVEMYLAARNEDGQWPLAQNNPGRALKLKIDQFREAGLRQVSPGVFKGRVLLRGRAQASRLEADFTVDFRSSLWKVAEMSLASDAGQPAAKPRSQPKKKVRPAAKAAAPGSPAPSAPPLPGRPPVSPAGTK
ncbi:MAG: hypothetical protein WC881_08345 [Elusimicrobiota bacterium]|jgi:hypothetical protein